MYKWQRFLGGTGKDNELVRYCSESSSSEPASLLVSFWTNLDGGGCIGFRRLFSEAVRAVAGVLGGICCARVSLFGETGGCAFFSDSIVSAKLAAILLG